MGRSYTKTYVSMVLVFFIISVFSGCAPKTPQSTKHISEQYLNSPPAGSSVDDSSEAPQLAKTESMLNEDRVFPTSESKDDCGMLKSFRFLAESSTAKYYAITYWSDGLQINGFLGVPKEGNGLPAIVYNRGGNRNFGVLQGNEIMFFTELGYVTVASQYRGNGGSEGKEEFGGADVNDVVNAVQLLETLPFVDANKIGMYGSSRGGMMTTLGIKHYYEANQSAIKSAVINSGEYDLQMSVKERPRMLTDVYMPLFGGNDGDASSESFQESLKLRSATQWPQAINVPLLILHGTADWRVPLEQAQEMVNLLKKQKAEFKYVFYEDDDHGLPNHAMEAWEETFDWFNSYLKPVTPLSFSELLKRKDELPEVSKNIVKNN